MADYQQGVPILITDTFRVAGVETNPTAIVYSISGQMERSIPTTGLEIPR